jgi:purine-nucleoside phosphorylase
VNFDNIVAGHAGKLIFGTLGKEKVPVMLLVGRAQSVASDLHSPFKKISMLIHFLLSFYEGHDMEACTFATRVAKVIGVDTMLLTNAAGGLNPSYSVGDIVCLNDHLNLAGLVGFHPLRGANEEAFGPRFPPLSDAYDLQLRQKAHQAWKDLRSESPNERRMHEGVYAYVSGPTYETRSECRLLHGLGADVVGMSTVPEIVVARHSGMRVLAFSLVTNNAVLEKVPRGDDPQLQGLTKQQLDDKLSEGKANHEEVLEAGQQAALDMQGLILRIVSQL